MEHVERHVDEPHVLVRHRLRSADRCFCRVRFLCAAGSRTRAGAWDVRKVKDFECMFCYAEVFNQDIGVLPRPFCFWTWLRERHRRNRTFVTYTLSTQLSFDEDIGA